MFVIAFNLRNSSRQTQGHPRASDELSSASVATTSCGHWILPLRAMIVARSLLVWKLAAEGLLTIGSFALQRLPSRHGAALRRGHNGIS
jgi:hypothetical protein